MKSIAILLWGLYVVASLVALVAALANFESILVTGPTLAASGLLLAAVTNRFGLPIVLTYALAGPLVCGAGSLLIAVNHWGPQPARGPLTTMLVAYITLSTPLAIVALQQIRKIPCEASPRFKLRFSLKSMLFVMTAVCLLIAAGQWLVQHLPDYPWEKLFFSYWLGFGGFALLTLILSAVVYLRSRTANARIGTDDSADAAHTQSKINRT